MNRPALIALFACLPLAGISQDAAKTKDAIDAARAAADKAAKEAGVELPDVKQEDIDKLLQKVSGEIEKARKKKDGEGGGEKDGGGKAADEDGGGAGDKDGPSIRIEKLPAWIPAIEGFQAAGLGRQWEGKVQTGKLKGTSTAKPDALADKFAESGGKGFDVQRTTRTANGVTRESVKLVKSGEPDQWVQLQAEPGKDNAPSQVRVTYSQPAAPGGGSPDKKDP